MQILIGLDPGEAGNFGWCIAQYTKVLPLISLACGLTDITYQAIRYALVAIPEGGALVSEGTDAPLFWNAVQIRMDEYEACSIRNYKNKYDFSIDQATQYQKQQVQLRYIQAMEWSKL